MKFRDIVDLLVVPICVIIFVFSAYFGAGNNLVSVAVLTVLMFVTFRSDRGDSLPAILIFCGVTLMTVPFIALLATGSDVSVAWIALFILVAKSIIVFGQPDRAPDEAPPPSRGDLAILILFLSGGLIGMSLINVEQIFYATWALALVHLERLQASTASRPVRMIGLFLVWAAILVYILAFWSGFGRLIIVSLALAPLFLTVRYKTFRLNILIFAAFAASLSFAGRIMRFGWSDGLVGLTEDSGAGPITLTETLWRSNASVLYQEPFWHQWSLLFLQWVPRSFWPGKPRGLGADIVDYYIGRQGFSEEHSYAVGYFGEHMFLAGDWWLFSTVVLTAIIIVIRRFIVMASAPYVSVAIVFDVWLVTLFWGGMASFGARVWFSAIPMLAYVVIIRARAALDRPRPEPMPSYPGV